MAVCVEAGEWRWVGVGGVVVTSERRELDHGEASDCSS